MGPSVVGQNNSLKFINLNFVSISQVFEDQGPGDRTGPLYPRHVGMKGLTWARG